ncbi:MAG: DUF1761 domain-containing protein [Flavobacteriaceae bacterium]
MKTKNFLVSGIVGTIVYFLLGWLFYAILFKDFFPPNPNEGEENILMIFLGCLTYALFIAYIFVQWAQISTAGTGAKAGAIIGLFNGLYWNFFYIAMDPTYPYEAFGVDLVIMTVSTAIVGAVIGAVNGKLG